HTRDWYSLRSLDADWKTDIYNTLDVYCRRTPGTFIEEKSFSLAWHYRQAEEGLGQLRAQELIADIKHIISDLGLQIVQGNKVLEIKSISVNKGTTARRFLDPATELILAIGDDMTDEDTFKAMPDHAITIKVGQTLSAAKYYLRSVSEVLVLLNDLAKFKAPHIADI
ncbi:MAG TPA: trehalose-phosphatase, partial [Flavipsychrobacter sp.]|nr:trehalose-phosphatase [Flavipsychrobacter sp.]